MTGNEKELKFIRQQIKGECEPGLKKVNAYRQSIRNYPNDPEIRRRVCNWCVYNATSIGDSGHCAHPLHEVFFYGDGSSPCIEHMPWFTSRFLRHWILNQFVGTNRFITAPGDAIGVAFAKRAGGVGGKVKVDIHHFPQAEYPMAQTVQICSSIAYRFIYKRWDDYTGENQV